MARKFRYNLRALLTIMFSVAVVAAVLTNRYFFVATHNEHLDAIKHAGGGFNIEWDRRNLTDKFFSFSPFIYNHVKYVRASHAAGFDDATVKHALELPELEVLEMGQTSITDNALAEIVRRDHPCLHSLHLDATGITDEGLLRLAKLDQLTDISISFCEQITDDGLRKFRELRPRGTVRVHR